MIIDKQRAINYIFAIIFLSLFVLFVPLPQTIKYFIFIVFNFLFIVSKIKKFNLFEIKFILQISFFFSFLLIIKLLPINFNIEISNLKNLNLEKLERDIVDYYQKNYSACLNNNICYGENEYDIKFKNKFNRQYLDISNINELRSNIFTSPGSTLVYKSEFVDKHNYPYILKLNFPRLYNGSSLCYDDYRKKNNCSTITDESNEFLIFGIGEKNELKLSQNYSLILIKILFFSILMILFLSLIRKLYSFRIRSRFELLYPSAFIFWLIIFSLTNYDEINFINSYFFQYPGGDGYWYLFLGNLISENFSQFNFSEALKGGKDIFYFMPGMRYFIALEKLLFGNAYYLHLIIFGFLPFILKKLFDLYLNKKIVNILMISFCFVPLMHHMGFSYYQYIRYASKVFAEPIAYTIFLYGFVRLVLFYSKKEEFFNTLPFTCLVLCISCILRPNLSSSSFFLLLLPFFYLLAHKKYRVFVYFLISGSVIFLPLIHNYIFGDQLVLFTAAVFTDANIKMTVLDYMKIFSGYSLPDEKKDMIIEIIWNFFHPIEIHKYFIIFGLISSLKIKYFKDNLIIPLHILIFSQLFLFPFLNPGPRYIWVFWLASLILALRLFFYKRNILLK